MPAWGAFFKQYNDNNSGGGTPPSALGGSPAPAPTQPVQKSLTPPPNTMLRPEPPPRQFVLPPSLTPNAPVQPSVNQADTLTGTPQNLPLLDPDEWLWSQGIRPLGIEGVEKTPEYQAAQIQSLVNGGKLALRLAAVAISLVPVPGAQAIGAGLLVTLDLGEGNYGSAAFTAVTFGVGAWLSRAKAVTLQRVGTSELGNALSDLGANNAIGRNINRLEEFGNGAGFSGVLDVESGRFLAYASGETTLANGAVPVNRGPLPKWAYAAAA